MAVQVQPLGIHNMMLSLRMEAGQFGAEEERSALISFQQETGACGGGSVAERDRLGTWPLKFAALFLIKSPYLLLPGLPHRTREGYS